MFGRKKKIEKRTVLFVDDDEAILRSLERGLLEEPYNKFFTKNCKEALEILRQEEVHVIVTDMRMAEMSGLEFVRIVKQEHPHIISMILTGFDKDVELQNAVDQGEIFRLIPKPWKVLGNFEKLVRMAVDQCSIQNGRKMVSQKN